MKGLVKTCALIILAFCLGITIAFPPDAWAQITFPGASPISAGNVTIQIKPQLFDMADGDRSIVDRNVLIYGASPNLAFTLQANSFVANSLTLNGRNGPRQVTASGLGDTTLEGRYTVFQLDGPGSTLRIAPYAGVVIPTGMDNTNSLISRAGQPGTGAWASRDALTISYQTLDWNAAAEAGYQANSSAANYHFGNTFFADAAYRYRLWPRSLEQEVSGELYSIFEVNFTSTDANQGTNQNIPGTGGKILLMDPGLIYTAKSYSVTLLGLIPAYERLRGSQSHFNYGMVAMFRLSFFTPHHW